MPLDLLLQRFRQPRVRDSGGLVEHHVQVLGVAEVARVHHDELVSKPVVTGLRPTYSHQLSLEAARLGSAIVHQSRSCTPSG